MVSRDLESNLLPSNAPELNILTHVVASAAVPVVITYPPSFPWPGKERLLDGFSGKMTGMDFCFKKNLCGIWPGGRTGGWGLAGEELEAGCTLRGLVWGLWEAGGSLQRQGFHTCQIGSLQMLVKVEPPPLSSLVESEFPRTEKPVLEWAAWADFCHQIKLGDTDVSTQHFVRSYAERLGMEKGHGGQFGGL